MLLTRRELLGRGGRVALGLTSGLVATTIGCSKNETKCVDPEFLSTPEQSLRTSQGYVDRSPHGEEKNCGGCQFFSRVGDEGCGRCQILSGPVSAAGVCSAWSRNASHAANGTGTT